MFRAMIEVVGAFFAYGPVSEDAAGRRYRLIAVIIVIAAVFAVAGIVSRH